jgi:rod shape determining protein RodA
MLRSFIHFDWVLLIATILLICLGILMILSTTLGEAGLYDLAIRQGVFALIGLGFLFTVNRFDYQIWRPLSLILYLISVGLLLFVFAYGFAAKGSVRWIDLGVFRFQPSELVKITTVILLADYMTTHNMKKFINLVTTAIFAAVPAALILIQPDLGSALVLLAIWLGMILLTEAPKKIFLTTGLVILVALPFAINFLQPYQRNRLISFLDPSADPLGTGYNVIQSTVAVGSGGLFGLGFGRGTQSHLNFLPEHHTDFIFATMAEELGLFGALLLLALLTIILVSLLHKIGRVSFFGSLTLVGLFVLIAFQAAINIGMNIGLAPVTGITLPFVSYGGSSLITLLAGIGLAESIIRTSKTKDIDDPPDLG